MSAIALLRNFSTTFTELKGIQDISKNSVAYFWSTNFLYYFLQLIFRLIPLELAAKSNKI